MTSSCWPHIIDREFEPWEGNTKISSDSEWEDDFLALDIIRRFVIAHIELVVIDSERWSALRSSLRCMDRGRFRELCWDIAEEIFRRNNDGRDGLKALPNHPQLPLGRHKTRQKLSSLSPENFLQVTIHIAREINRRSNRQYLVSNPGAMLDIGSTTSGLRQNPDVECHSPDDSHETTCEERLNMGLLNILDNYHNTNGMRRNSEPEILQNAYPILSRDRFDSTLSAIYSIFKGIMTNKERHTSLLSCEGQTAQDTLDVLQMLLDHSRVAPPMRNQFLLCLFQLSGLSGLQPRCFTLKGVTRLGNRDEFHVCGGFSEVWKGLFQSQTVCVKVLKVYQTSNMKQLIKAMSREAVLWGHLSHPNVLPFYGVYHLQENGVADRMCLVSPWMDGGTINEFLARNPDAPRLTLIRDVARGLRHLHRHNIIHGDLKGANILVSKLGRACLSDFGLSTIANRDGSDTESPDYFDEQCWGGTPRWQAPELFDPKIETPIVSTASDVYAFGCVCYEVFTSLRPFYETQNDLTVVYRVMKGDKPSWPDHPYDIDLPKRGLTRDSALWSTMQACWDREPAMRPTIGEVIVFLGNRNDDGTAQGFEKMGYGPSEFRNAVYRTNYLSVSALESVLSWM